MKIAIDVDQNKRILNIKRKTVLYCTYYISPGISIPKMPSACAKT